MDNQLSSTENMSVSAISALTSVKEVHGEQRNYIHMVLLLLMVVFTVFIVGLSVYNFQGSAAPEVQAISAEAKHSDDLQRLTNQ